MGFMPGPMEMRIIGIIALLMFGKRLPEVARSLGSSVKEFQKGINSVQDEVDTSLWVSVNKRRPTSREHLDLRAGARDGKQVTLAI